MKSQLFGGHRRSELVLGNKKTLPPSGVKAGFLPVWLGAMQMLP